MTTEKLITLAIHTYDKALPVKALLEREGIHVELNNVDLTTPAVFAGVRVRVPVKDLPLALRLVENFEIFAYPGELQKQGGLVLVPVDFSHYSTQAVKMAFTLAAAIKGHITLLHSFVPPDSADDMQLTDSYDFELDDVELTRRIEHDSRQYMSAFEHSLRSAIKRGDIPAVKFDSVVTQGIPEESILEYARAHNPSLIVMGTRGAGKKKEELIGSVTAEVLDSCRTPAFTVPENVRPDFFSTLRSIGFFCNLDQQDMLALDALYRMFPVGPDTLEVTLVHIPSRRSRLSMSVMQRQETTTMTNLLEYCRTHFPGYRFKVRELRAESIEKDVAELVDSAPFDMVCMPNKRRSVFARFFNPSLAHRILFRADIPMMVIPVG